MCHHSRRKHGPKHQRAWYAQRLELARVAHERLAGIPIIHDAEYAFPDGLWLNSWVILKKAE